MHVKYLLAQRTTAQGQRKLPGLWSAAPDRSPSGRRLLRSTDAPTPREQSKAPYNKCNYWAFCLATFLHVTHAQPQHVPGTGIFLVAATGGKFILPEAVTSPQMRYVTCRVVSLQTHDFDKQKKPFIKLRLLHQASWVCLCDETLSLGDRILESWQEHLQGQVQTSNRSSLESSSVRSSKNTKIRVINRHTLSSVLHSTRQTPALSACGFLEAQLGWGTARKIYILICMYVLNRAIWDSQYYLQNVGNPHPHVLRAAWPGISWETGFVHPAFVQGEGRDKLLSKFFVQFQYG